MLNTIRRLKIWTLRAWPVLAITALLCLHFLLLDYTTTHGKIINGTIALASQIIGGLLVLYSIDSNIGILRGSSLYEELIQYLREFPLFKESIVLQPHASIMKLTGMDAELTVRRNPKTVDERLDYLQEQIDALQEKLRDKIIKLNKKIEYKAGELGGRLDAFDQSLDGIQKKVDQVSIGGAKIQLFGVMLLVYGAITGYLA